MSLAASRLRAITRYGLRACLPRARLGVLLIPCLAAVLFGLLSHVTDAAAQERFNAPVSIGIFGLALPLGALVIGDAVFGAEVRAGTLLFTWQSPARAWEMAVGRWAAATLICGASLGGACLVAALVAGEPGAVVPLVAAVVLGGSAYIAVFLLVGTATRRAAVWSLALVFIVERLLGAALAGVAQWSPGWVARGLYAAHAPDAAYLLRDGVPSGGWAAARLAVIVAVALGLAQWQIGRMRIGAARD